MRTDADGEASLSEARALDRAAAENIARSLRAMADPTRVQLLGLIVAGPGGRALVGELATTLGLTQPTVSHHMRIMAEEGLLAREQIGRQAWYSVVPDRIADVIESTRRQHDPVAAVVAPHVLARITEDLAIRFHGVFSPETIGRYVQESYELLDRQAKITRYLPSLTARFAGDRLRALSAADGKLTHTVPEVLFVCVQNAGRSQLASALLRSLAGDRVRVLTAGSEPAGAVNPLVVAALDEIGVPLAGEYPKPLTHEVVRAADYVITMGCGDACPVFAGRTYLDWDLADPVGLPMEGVRVIRDEIDVRVRALLVVMGIRAAPAT
ncbi:metalloregulator ArsR/SmtB family transcription factor [Cryobacterium algoritolerans]|uniref:Metalloregulator ArsR/SmtB family transcription factor n=1 Tax=Cryobacterium algoritolerans TaxID=1259184 RepID=A0A4R8WV50_9MICO|nr:metalloregulator ArsR/SmtB family transcription factor [Cryobacterium algoritolerans]TFC17950.1 metalloregulator ArsR/SmtB family transcription factor [Cryobacterium algoritolerans]